MKKLGFLGPMGTHSEAAALYLTEKGEINADLVAYDDILTLMQAVTNKEIDSCLVPVENSLEGSINITLDLLAHEEELMVARELIWGVHNHLMANCPRETIRTIYSHGQPLAQCRNFLKKNFPKAQLIATSSTARAAAAAASFEPAAGIAAICTERAGMLYGLKSIEMDIQDNMTNCTRFYEVKRSENIEREKKGDKLLFICQIDGKRAGSLCEILEEFAHRKVNMTRIESRPARTGLGEYIFFFDLEADEKKEDLMSAVSAVEARSVWYKSCGKFPVIYADNFQKQM